MRNIIKSCNICSDETNLYLIFVSRMSFVKMWFRSLHNSKQTNRTRIESFCSWLITTYNSVPTFLTVAGNFNIKELHGLSSSTKTQLRSRNSHLLPIYFDTRDKWSISGSRYLSSQIVLRSREISRESNSIRSTRISTMTNYCHPWSSFDVQGWWFNKFEVREMGTERFSTCSGSYLDDDETRENGSRAVHKYTPVPSTFADTMFEINK